MTRSISEYELTQELMKSHRLQFQAEFLDLIKAGLKTGTIRRSKPSAGVGDVFAPITHRFCKFADAPFLLRCTGITELTFAEVTDAHLARTTVNREWYTNRYPDLKPDSVLYFIEFEVAE